MLFMYMYFSFLLVVLGRNYAIYICHFDNLDIFFVSFQNRERVHSSEKQRKWRSDRTKGKVQFVWCFYGHIGKWVISRKNIKLSELQFERNFGVFFFLKILVIIFLQLHKKCCIWQWKLQRIDQNNDKEWKHLLSFWVLMVWIFFFQRLRTENRLLRQRIEALEKVLPVLICYAPQW